MNHVNLIPIGRQQARRAAARVRCWMWVIPASAGLLVAAYIINWLNWDTNTQPASDALAEIESQIQTTNRRVSTQSRELREAGAMLRANLAVGEQPDWSLLLHLLVDRLGDHAALTACVLEPVAPPADAKAAPKSEGGTGGRPELLKLSIKGVAATQEAASRFVLELEQSGAFDSVHLVETQRAQAAGDGIAFEVACGLSDPGGGEK